MFSAVSKLGQDTTSSDGSPMTEARLTSLALQGQCKESASSQGSGSPVNPVNEYDRKRVSLTAENRVVLAQMPKLEVRQCIDKIWSTWLQGNLGRKT